MTEKNLDTIRVVKGTIITCPNCGRSIAEVQRNLRRFDMVHAEDLKGIEQEIKTMDRMTCSRCGVDYFLGGSFHTEKGWI